MQITDTIADLLTRIRNANAAKHDSVEIPASNYGDMPKILLPGNTYQSLSFFSNVLDC